MRATDHTVRMRPFAGIDAETVRVRPVDLPSKPVQPQKPAKPLPPVISGMDAKTVRHRIVDMAVKPLPSAIADRIPRTVAHRPSKWLAARVLLVLLLASMPILGDLGRRVRAGLAEHHVDRGHRLMRRAGGDHHVRAAPDRHDRRSRPDRRDGGMHRL